MSQFTDDLLAEVRESVAADVAAEEARIQAELEARAAAEEQAAREAEAARRAEIETRLEAERHRRRLATEGRRATPADPTVPQTDDRAAAARAAFQQASALSAAPQPPAPARRGAGFYFVVMGLPMLCITAIAVAWLLATPQPAIDLTPKPVPTADRGPVFEVADPSAPDVTETRVSAEVGAEATAEGAGDEADAPEAKPDEKKKAEPANKPRTRKPATERDRAAAGAKETTGERPKLILGNDFMKAD